MNKKLLLTTLAILVIVVSGCDADSGTGPGDSGFAGGTKGVEIAFLQNSPPPSVSDGGQEPFPVTVTLTNRGEYEVPKEDIFVRITGFSATEFGVTNDDLTKHPDVDLVATIKGPDGVVIPAPTEYLDFGEFNYQGHAIGNLEFPFKAEVCYKYETTAVSDICVKENFNSVDPSDLCKVSGTRRVSNSGAPVQVMSVSQAPGGVDRTRVTFSVQNRDVAGRVFTFDTQCDIAQINRNKVFVTVSGVSENPQDTVICTGLQGGGSASGYLILSDGTPREVSCTIQLSDRNPRIQPFRITLEYDYSKHVQQNLQVVHMPE